MRAVESVKPISVLTSESLPRPCKCTPSAPAGSWSGAPSVALSSGSCRRVIGHLWVCPICGSSSGSWGCTPSRGWIRPCCACTGRTGGPGRHKPMRLTLGPLDRARRESDVRRNSRETRLRSRRGVMPAGWGSRVGGGGEREGSPPGERYASRRHSDSRGGAVSEGTSAGHLPGVNLACPERQSPHRHELLWSV